MHTETIYARIPRKLERQLEQERKRRSRVAGAEVKRSAVIRALLEEALSSSKRAAA